MIPGFKNVVVCAVIFAALFSNPIGLYAQQEDSASTFISFSYGADFVSRYIWRGNVIAAANSDEAFVPDSTSNLSLEMKFVPHIQPSVSIDFNFEKAGNLTLGAWGSYSLKGKYSELDLILGYKVPFSFGSLGLTFTDYIYPYIDSINIFNFKGNGEGANTIEAALSFTGPESFPLTLLVSRNIHNDPADENSLYVEAGYPLTFDDISLNFFIGAAKGISAWHNISSEKMEICNVGFTLSKSIDFNDSISLPVGVSFVLNPHISQSFLVFKLSL